MEKQIIQQTIKRYAKAVDAQNADNAEKFLDNDFRVVLHNYNRSGVTQVFLRQQYIDMMRAGKVGGNKRAISFLLTDVHETAAIVKVQLSGERSLFTNYYSLIKKDKRWLIVNDIPHIIGNDNK